MGGVCADETKSARKPFGIPEMPILESMPEGQRQQGCGGCGWTVLETIRPITSTPTKHALNPLTTDR
jgi:hypothetical protein